MTLPYLTAAVGGIGGSLKNRSEDFFVQELPLYQPSGEGEHIYCEIEKIGLTTFDVINRLASALRVHPKDIGYAGLKDARAVTRQTFSIFGSSEQAIRSLEIRGLSVLSISRHGNKLRPGHLAGNRFAVKIRDVDPTDVVKLVPHLEMLRRVGMPNYFGEQRFGRRGDNYRLGAALIRGDDAAVLSLLLGSPNLAMDDAQAQGARKAFDRGDLDQAMRLFPRRCGMERRVLARLIKSRDPSAAVRVIDEKLRRLWVSALQSELFNQVVARRISGLNRLEDGDLAMKHENGACFLVESAVVEQPRCDSFEISPTGPLVGYRVSLPQGRPLSIEQQVLTDYGLAPEDFRVEGRHKVKGTRRPLRVQPKDIETAGGVDEFGQYISVSFTLPPGSFATVLLGELMKTPSGE